MAKANKKSAKESSNIFHNIMAATVKGNPKLKKKTGKPIKNTDVIEHREGGDLNTKKGNLI